MNILKRIKAKLSDVLPFGAAFLMLFLMPQILYAAVTVPRADVELVELYADYARLPAIAGVILTFLSVFSVFRSSILFDRAFRQDYFDHADAARKAKLRFLAGQKRFWIRALVIAVPLLLLPLDLTNKPLAVLFGVDTLVKKLCVLPLLFAVLLGIGFAAYLSAMTVWRKNGSGAVYRLREYLKSIGLIAVIYLAGGVFLVSLLIPMILPFLVLLYAELGLVPVWILLAVSVLLRLIRLIRALHTRRTFLKKLKTVCAEKDVTLSEVRQPYRSVLAIRGGESFHISFGGKSYSCKLIASPRKLRPAQISPDGVIAYLHTFRLFKRVIFQYSIKHRFGYEPEGKKIVILNPTPKHIYSWIGGHIAPIDNAETVGSYKIFSATGFLNAIERDVLDR